jgi:hypothetical protein
MSMRKWLCLILVVCILALMFSGCKPKEVLPEKITGEIIDSYESEEVDLEQQPYGEEPELVEYYELSEDASAIEDADATWAEGVVFISDSIAEKILQAEKNSRESTITISVNEKYEIDNVLVHSEKIIAYKVVEIEKEQQATKYSLVRAELGEIFSEIEIRDQTVMLNHDNLAFVGEGVNAQTITSSILHKFEINQSFFDDMIRVTGEVEFLNPGISTRMGSDGYELAFTAKESANLKVEGELNIDRELRFIIAAYAFDIKVKNEKIGQAAVGVFLAVDVKGNIRFIYEIDQSYELKVGVRGKTAKIPFTSIYFPTSASTFYEMNQKFEVTPPTLTGELTVRLGILATAELTIYKRTIVEFNILVAIEGTAKFQLKQGDSFLRLEIDVLLLIDGKVRTISIKWGWTGPRLSFPLKSFRLLYQRWNIYTFETSKQTPLGKIPVLTVDSYGTEDVPIDSTTGHGGTTSYSLPISEEDIEVCLEAPEFSDSGPIRRGFTHWSGDIESTERVICFPVAENMNVIANYGYLLSVNSSGATQVPISSSTGHAGTSDYEETLRNGTEVALEAPEYVGTGQERKRFSSWSGAVSSEARNITLSMDDDQTVTANYVEDPVFTLSVSSQGASNVRITSPTGHGGTTSYEKDLAKGINVTLEAPQYVGGGQERKRFNSWSGAVTRETRKITLTMNADQTLTANYVDDPTENFTVTVSSEGASNVRITSPTGHGGTTDYAKDVIQGTMVTLEAPLYVGKGEERKKFSAWSGVTRSQASPWPSAWRTEEARITLTMSADQDVTATYEDDPEIFYTLRVGIDFDPVETLVISSPTGHGGQIPPSEGGGYYQLRVRAGTKVTLIAPDIPPYYICYSWRENETWGLISDTREATFIMERDLFLFPGYD